MDDPKEEIRSRMDEHPFDRYFDADPETVEIVNETLRGWAGWPTDPDAAPLWAVAFADTGNMNAPEVTVTDPFSELAGESILDVGASPTETEAIRKFRDFTQDYTRSRGRGESFNVYRFVEDPPEEAAGLEARVLESWTGKVTTPREFARRVRGSEDGSVVTAEVSADQIYGSHETHPALAQKNQQEFIVGLPRGATYGEYDITPLTEWEF